MPALRDKLLFMFNYIKSNLVKTCIISALVVANISTFSVFLTNQNYISNKPQVLGKAIDTAKARASKPPKPTKAPKESKAPKSKPSLSPTPTPWPTDSSLYQEYYLSDIPWVSATNREGQGSVEKDKSNKDEKPGGNTITLNGKTYTKGLGVHAQSKIIYNIQGKCSRFNAIVGLDDEAGPLGSVGFELRADKNKIGETGIMRGSTPNYAMYKDIPPGTQTLELKVNTADGPIGFTYSDDHADWADAKIKCLKGTFGSGASASPSPLPGESPGPVIRESEEHPRNFKATLEFDPATNLIKQIELDSTTGDYIENSTDKPSTSEAYFSYKVVEIHGNKLFYSKWHDIKKRYIVSQAGTYRFVVMAPYNPGALVKLYSITNQLIWSGEIK